MTSNNRLQINEPESGIDLRKILSILGRWIWLLLLGGIIGAGIAYWITLQIAPIYEAKSLILIEQNRASSAINAPELLTNERTNTYLEFINQGLMDDKVAARLGIDVPQLEISIDDIRIAQVGRTELFEITVRGYSPDYVAAVANALPDALNQSIVDVRQNRFEESKANLSAQLSSLKLQMDLTEAAVDRIGTPRTNQEENELRSQEEILAQYRSSYADLVQSYENVRLIEIQSLDNISVARSAEIPKVPVSSNLLINAILGLIIGVSTALTFIVLVEYLDDSVKDPDAIQQVVNGTLLGVIAPIPSVETELNELDEKLITLHEPRHLLSEQYRIIRTNLRFATADSEKNLLMVTSASSNEGKSTTVANLAISMAQSGQNVLIIDADLRKPSQHLIFDTPMQPGLVESLYPTQEGESYSISTTVQPNLFVLTSGQSVPNPTDILESERLKQMVSLLQTEFDVVLIDTPPILPVSDAAVLAGFVPNVILVANAETARQTELARAVEALNKVGVQPVGTILNQYRVPSQDYYEYDSYNGMEAEGDV